MSQLLSNPAVLSCELAVASGVGPVFVAIAVFGCSLVYLCGTLLAVCGFLKAGSHGSLRCPHLSPHSLDSLTCAECLLDGPQVRIKCDLGGAVCELARLKPALNHCFGGGASVAA